MQKIVVDGLSIETTEQGAQIITRLQQQLGDAQKATTDSAAAHATAIAAKDTEIGTLKADLQKAKDALPKADAIDQMVADRVHVIGLAKALDKDIKVEGVSNADIRKAAVAKKMGDAAVKDAPEAQIEGMFIALTKDLKPGATTDALREAVRGGIKTVIPDDARATNDAAYGKSVDNLNDWRNAKTA